MKTWLSKITVSLLLLLAPALAFSAPIVSHYPEPKAWIAIGDIHGDDKVLEQVLIENKVVDENLNWIANDLFVIFTGDLLDRGPNSRRVMDILMRLQIEARDHGGHLVCLKGNHELMVTRGDLRYFARGDMENYKSFAQPGDQPEDAVRRAFSGDSLYANWLADNPTGITVGRTLFIHAGVESWIAAKTAVAALNEIMQQWFLYFQGRVKTQPSEKLSWVLGDSGPLWARKLSAGEIPAPALKSWLKAAEVDRVVVGHTITQSREPESSYNGQVLRIDTGMSIAYGGRPSALLWSRNEASGKARLEPFSTARWESPRACRVVVAPVPERVEGNVASKPQSVKSIFESLFSPAKSRP